MSFVNKGKEIIKLAIIIESGLGEYTYFYWDRLFLFLFLWEFLEFSPEL